jgi:hypothetical protein
MPGERAQAGNDRGRRSCRPTIPGRLNCSLRARITVGSAEDTLASDAPSVPKGSVDQCAPLTRV